MTEGKDLIRKFVFPACAGMSPEHPRYVGAHRCFPRMRGDEPDGLTNQDTETGFSPHARG